LGSWIHPGYFYPSLLAELGRGQMKSIIALSYSLITILAVFVLLGVLIAAANLYGLYASLALGLYTIIAFIRPFQPAVPPRCQVCFASFPTSELGEWLVYERAEPEWTVSEWLTGEASPNRASRHLEVGTLVERVMKIVADPALPSSQCLAACAVSTSDRLITVSGIGGFCEPNTQYQQPPGPHQQSRLHS
jgi:hypothetical protein